MKNDDTAARGDGRGESVGFGTASTAEGLSVVTVPDEIARAIRTVLRGFDEHVFVRSTDGDMQSGWAIRLLPFIAALGVLEDAYGPSCLGEDCPIHGGPNPEGQR